MSRYRIKLNRFPRIEESLALKISCFFIFTFAKLEFYSMLSTPLSLVHSIRGFS